MPLYALQIDFTYEQIGSADEAEDSESYVEDVRKNVAGNLMTDETVKDSDRNKNKEADQSAKALVAKECLA